MGAFLTDTTLGFPDATENYAPTPFAREVLSWNANGSSTNVNLDFTGMPDWAKRITIAFSDLQLTTNDEIGIRLGDSGGFETTGYEGTFTANTTGAFSSSQQGIRSGASNAFTIQTSGSSCGVATLQKAYATNRWVLSYVGGNNVSTGLRFSNGFKTLTSTLTQIRVTSGSGSAYFSSGDVIVYFE
jgi:hypothetical protein